MKPSIEIIISPTGEIQIDAINFKGPDCEAATRFLEQALGVTTRKVKKPEYHRSNRTQAKQRIGG